MRFGRTSEIIAAVTGVFALCALIGVTVLVIRDIPPKQVINCQLAEISPDYPKEVREKCRLIRSGRLL